MSETFIEIITTYGYLAVFIGSVLEGESMLLAGAFAASLGWLKFSWVIIVAFFGAIIGDNLTYLIGRHGGRPLIKRFGRYILLTPQRLLDIKGHFHEHGGKTMFITRFIWGTRLPTTLLAGALRMNYHHFLIANCLSAILWASLVGTLGFVFGQSWALLRVYMKGTAISLLIFLALAFTVKWLLRRAFHKELDVSGKDRVV